MLFDLRSRGRRRTVQAVYLGLAILIAAGLLLVGVGTGSGGGILNAFTNNGSGGAQKQVVSQEEQQALKAVRANPNDAAAWGQLLSARWTSAGQSPDYNATTGTFSAAGKRELAAAASAWQRYVSLTKSPDPDLTIVAARVYQALSNYSGAASAWEQETLISPNEIKGYECLALDAYAAGQARKGDLATSKALSMVPSKAQQTTLKTTLNSAKASAQTAQTIAQASC